MHRFILAVALPLAVIQFVDGKVLLRSFDKPSGR